MALNVNDEGAGSLVWEAQLKTDTFLQDLSTIGARVNDTLTQQSAKQQQIAAQQAEFLKSVLTASESLRKIDLSPLTEKPLSLSVLLNIDPSKATAELQAFMQQADAGFTGLDDQTQRYVVVLSQLQQQLARINQAQDALSNLKEQGAVSVEAYTTALQNLSAQSKAVSASISELVATQKQYDQIQTASTNQFNERKAQLESLSAEYSRLSEAEKASGKGTDLLDNITKTQSEIAELIATVSQAQKAFARLGEIKTQLGNTPINDKSFQALLAEATELQTRIGAIGKNLSIDNVDTKSLDGLTATIQAIIQKFSGLENSFSVIDANAKETGTLFEQTGEKALTSVTTQKEAFDALRPAIESSTAELQKYTEALKASNQPQPTSHTEFLAQPQGFDEQQPKILEEIDQKTKEHVDTLEEEKKRTEEITNARNELNDAYKEGMLTQAQYKKGLDSLDKAEGDLKKTQSEPAADDKLSLETLEQKKQALTFLTSQWEKLTKAEQDDVNIGGQMREQAQQLKSEISTLSLDNLTDSGKKAVSIMTQIRLLENQIASNPADPGTDARIEQVGQLRKEWENVRRAVALASSNTAGLDAMRDGIRGLVGGFTALQGVMGIFDSDNKAAAETTKVVTSAMAIATGVEQLFSVAAKDSALNIYLRSLASKQAAVAQTAETVATEATVVAEGEQAAVAAVATESQLALNGAMLANPVGIILISLTALIGLLEVFTSHNKEAREAQIALNEALNSAGKGLDAEVSGIENANAKIVASMKARGASDNEVSQQQIKNSELIQAARRRELEDLNKTLSNPDNTFASDEQTKQVRDKALQLQFDIQKGETEIYTSRQDLAKKFYDESFKSQAARAEAALALTHKNTQEQYEAEKVAIEARRKLALDNANLTPGEIAKINADAQKAQADADRNFAALTLQNRKALIDKQLALVQQGTAKELALKIQSLRLQEQIQEKADGVTPQAQQALRAQELKAENDLRLKYTQDEAKAELDAVSANLNSRLAYVQKGSQEELSLREALLKNEADAEVVQAAFEIKNEELKAAKFRQIWAKYFTGQKALEDKFADEQVARVLKQIDNAATIRNAQLDQTINNPFASNSTVFEAQREKLLGDITDLEAKHAALLAQIQSGQGDVTKLQDQADQIDAAIKKANGALVSLDLSQAHKQITNLASDFGAVSSAVSSLAGQLKDLNPKLSFSLQQISEMTNLTSDLLTAGASGFADPAADIKGITDLLTFFVNAKKSAIEAKKELEAFDTAMETAQFNAATNARKTARDQAAALATTMQGLTDEAAILNKQKLANTQQFNDIMAQIAQQQFVASEHTKRTGLFFLSKEVVQDFQSLAGKSYEDLQKLFDSGRLDDKAKALFQQLEKLKAEGVDIDSSLADIQTKVNEAVTGTTADAITNSIAEGFANGDRTVAAFAGRTQDVVRNALLQALKVSVLQPAMQKIFDQFAKDAQSGGGLDTQEIANFTAAINKTIEDGAKFAEQVERATGVSLSNLTGSNDQNSLKGAIKGITEQQAELLAGQFGGQRIATLELVEIQKVAQTKLNGIEQNTALTVTELRGMREMWSRVIIGNKLQTEIA